MDDREKRYEEVKRRAHEIYEAKIRPASPPATKTAMSRSTC